MICGKCQSAGNWNAAAVSIPDDRADDREGYHSLAKRLHAECEFPDCSCQHKVGHYVVQ